MSDTWKTTVISCVAIAGTVLAGNTRFYVEYLGETYELTIKRP